MAATTDTSSLFSTCLTLLSISLLLFSHFTMAMLEHSFSLKEGTKHRNNIVVKATSAKEGRSKTQNSKTLEETLNDTVVSHQLKGTKRGRSRPPRSPLQRRNRNIFNASAHEVPSGPNPSSNR
ncbi:CLAVATA3/ESR (CLE)-related protein TDIF [Trifolium repens]|nr:CLAVATA3/ESR (CLE)-related protein TDIF [Trifolium repens]